MTFPPTAVRSVARRIAGVLCTAAFVFAAGAQATEVKVMISGGFSAAFQSLVPDFEKASGHHVVTIKGPSMGETPEAIPNRLARGEAADVVIMVAGAVDDLAKANKVVPGSRVDLAVSKIAMAVPLGAPPPDISTVDAFKRTLLAAKSIAYSDSASGVYLSTVLFPRLGIADQIKGKSKMIPAEPVGAVVARGDAQIGFQQVSELQPFAGKVTLVGPIPADAQKLTTFSAGLVAGSPQQTAARQLVQYLASPNAVPAILKSGMEPVAAK